MSSTVTVVCWNQENNGKGDPARRRASHEKLKSLGADVVFRQEMWDAGAHGKQIFSGLEEILGLRGELGPKSCTALFFNPDKFAVVRDWDEGLGPAWVLPPTARTMRYLPAGRDSQPIVMVSYHLAYGSSSQRLTESEWLTTFADKSVPTPDGPPAKLAALIGGDNNSYPVPGTPGDPALPALEKIKDRPHRLHRSYLGPDGIRRMDDRPDDVLRTAGLEDVARYWATAPQGSVTAVARTVNACDTYGPDSRIDRVYATPQLLPALRDVDVIEVDEDMSDHHIVRVRFDTDALADILRAAAVPLT